MIRISKKDGINVINIQAYDAVYLLTILDLTENKEKISEEVLEKLSSLKMYNSMGYKYFSLDFKLDNRNYLYILLSTLIQQRTLFTRDYLLELSSEESRRLIVETRKELLNYNQFSEEYETKKKVVELNYFINTLYYISHANKLVRNNLLEHLEKIGVTDEERQLILKESTE